MLGERGVDHHRPACVYGWLHVAAIETVVHEIDIFASSTGEFNIDALDHMLKKNTIVGNT